MVKIVQRTGSWYRGQDHGTDDKILVQIVQKTGSWNRWQDHDADGTEDRI